MEGLLGETAPTFDISGYSNSPATSFTNANSGTCAVPTVTHASGQTFTSINSVTNVSGATKLAGLFRCISDTDRTSGAITVDWGAQTTNNYSYQLLVIPNPNPSGTNGSGAILASGAGSYGTYFGSAFAQVAALPYSSNVAGLWRAYSRKTSLPIWVAFQTEHGTDAPFITSIVPQSSSAPSAWGNYTSFGSGNVYSLMHWWRPNSTVTTDSMSFSWASPFTCNAICAVVECADRTPRPKSGNGMSVSGSVR